MPPDSEVNPYAPPGSEISTRPAGEASVKRPMAVKWVRAVFLVGTIGVCLFNGKLIHDKGWQWFYNAYREHPWSIVEPAMRFPGLVALWAFDRKPFAYWLAATSLGLLVYETFVSIYRDGVRVLRNLELIPEFIGVGIGCFLITYLFYRFTFGRPSRIYYRVTRASSEEK